MLTFNTVAFYRATVHLSAIKSAIESVEPHLKAAEGDADMTEDHKATTLKSVNELQKELEVIGAPVANMAVDRLAKRLSDKTKKFTYEELVKALDAVESRLRDELSLTLAFTIEPSKTRFFDNTKPPFGSDVALSFLSANFEIDEAAKCLALSRSTASVFHLMRTIEIGIQAIARCLAIPDPTRPSERNWGNILGEIDKETKKRWPTVTARQSGDGAFFDRLYVSLDAVRNPVRNATMHVENKYTDDEAEHIFEMSKGFMKQLTSRMDEAGLPLA
jgi:hypothetical protein